VAGRYLYCFLWRLLAAALLLGAARAEAAAPRAQKTQARIGNLPASSLYVPLSIDRFAASSLGITFPAPSITVGGVPFELVSKPGADNFFLKSAEWIDWKKDPGSHEVDYDRGPDAPGDPRMPMFKIPVADYSAVYLLAAADNDQNLSNAVSFRIGCYESRRRTVQHDFSGTVPRLADRSPSRDVPALSTPAGNLFLVRVPLGKAYAQDFQQEWAMDVEVTKQLRLAICQPDPCRFQYRPLGVPSGVHIFGMTFQRSPVQIEVTSDQSGHVFNEPQTPTFHVALLNVQARPAACTLEAVATDYFGGVTKAQADEVELHPGQRVVRDVAIQVPKRGYHDLAVIVKLGGAEVIRRETTFALLPQDTRKYRDDSPFGTGYFAGSHYTPSDPEIVGPLYVKAGLRYGMSQYSAEARRKYGVLVGNEVKRTAELANRLQQDPQAPKRVLIFHENSISRAHVMRLPELFTGFPSYQFNEKEQAKLDAMWQQAQTLAKEYRQQNPAAQISLGNGTIHLMDELLKRRFPKELFDSRGNECPSFMRMPESQPLDFESNNASLWMDRQLLDHYGYRDKPVTQCYEICYPGTNPGNLSPQTQASYFVRHAVHSLAWGIPVFRPGMITDCGDSYYFSHWGASGLCYAMPEVRPKPSYVALATMTQCLDSAKFSRVIPTGSTVVYAVEFARKDGGYLTVLWTIRGTRALRVEAAGASPTVLTDMMGNQTPIAFAGGAAEVPISHAPGFLATRQPLARVSSGQAVLESRPTGKSFVVSPLGKLAEWKVQRERSVELETYNFECPRRKGDFQYREVTSFEGENNVLEILPRLPLPGSPYLPMYSVLAHATGVEIPGEPTEIGLMLNGNGGWGRMIFELEDASGQRWISLGATAKKKEASPQQEQYTQANVGQSAIQSVICDWNTNDIWRRSSINFDGWRYMKFPLPGNFPGEGYHWPFNSQWRSGGDGVVKYPLKFKKLIVELPEKVLHVKDYAAAPRQAVYLKDLLVTYEPPEKAFTAE
jgi:hypothetical protein